MKDPRLAAALLESSPDALAELFDAYGDRLFRYCWSMLRSRELAQVALRDTLLVAQAHIARLADPEDPESLGPWLYSLARAECRRHQAVSPAAAAESPAWQGLPAADARLTSWNAAMSLDAAEFEALDLACRHYVDLALILGLPAGEADGLLDRARQKLERSLGAEILVGRGPACPGLEAILAGGGTGHAGQPGPLGTEARERVLEHAGGCAACGPAVPRNVSATRVFALLPAPALTPQDRAGILAVLAGRQPPAAPALAQAALVPTPAAPTPAAAAAAAAFAAAGRALAAPAVAAAPVAAPPVAARGAAAAVAAGASAFGPPLASYVRASEPPARFLAAPVPASVASAGSVASAAPVAPAPAPPAASAPFTRAPSAAPAAFAAGAASPAPAGPHAPHVPASNPSAQRAARPRPVHRGRLLIAGAGVIVSAVVMASAIAMAGPGGHDAAGSITPTLAAGGATGPALQGGGPGAAGPVSSRAAAGGAGAHPAGTRLATPPPLVSTKGDKNEVMITAATQPLSPDQAPGAQPAAGGASGAGGASAAPGTLQLSAGGVALGTGNAGQITLTAAGGTVSWSASVSRPDQVSLNSYGGTLPAGQSITVTVQVSRGSAAGSAAISFQGGGSATQVVPVSWSAQPDGSGTSWHGHRHRHPSPPGPSPSPGTMAGTDAPNPTSLGPGRRYQPGPDDPARSRSRRL